MKRTILLCLLLLTVSAVCGQKPQLRYTQASELNVIGRAGAVEHPYQRVDVAQYPELTATESALLRQPAGMAVVFRTDSPIVTVRTKYRKKYNGTNSTLISGAGFDLYIRRDGAWLYAGSQVQKNTAPDLTPVTLVRQMDATMKECLLYLPLFSELETLEIGTEQGSTLEAMENPFRRRIVYFGSSLTHGSGTSRAGMTVPAQLARNSGLYFINLGVSGNSKLQPVFADILAGSDAEALVVDGFSNPQAEEIESRLFPFIDRIRAVRPDVPIVFVRTVYREGCNFDRVKRAHFGDRDARAARMARLATQRYDDVYFLDMPDPTGTDHITSTDGTHPSDLGYWRWAECMQSPLTEILARYGIE